MISGMDSKSKIRIISNLGPEVCSKVTHDNVTYDIHTEDSGKKSRKLISRVYKRGKIVLTKQYSYEHLPAGENFERVKATFIEESHKSTVHDFLYEVSGKTKKKAEYLKDVESALERGKGKTALNIIKQALKDFPFDPFLLSYYGCLIAVVQKEPREGIKICKSALSRLDASMPLGSEFYHPIFYLNLGRAYLSGSKKPEAIKVFKKGLMNDPNNAELLEELDRLGVRQQPVVNFLERSNPINKYIGFLVSNVSKRN